MPVFLRRRLLLLCALASLACGGGDLVLPNDSGPATLTIIKGDAQTGVVGAPLSDSIVVEVTDPLGRALSGVEVAFVLGVGAGGGRVSPDTAPTGADGRAGARWVLGGTAGTQAVSARVVGAAAGAGLVATFTATATAGSPQAVAALSGDNQSAPVGTALPDSLVVEVTDPYGNPVSGVTVHWAVSTGSVSPLDVATGADGRAATRRILGSSAGTQTATATTPGLSGSPVTFTHTAVPGTASSLVLVSGNDQLALPGTTLTDLLVVRLVDTDGNGIPGHAVSWIVGTGGGSVAPAGGSTNGDGYASASFTLGSAPGTNTVNAVVSGVGFVTFTATATGGGGGGGPSASLSTVSAAPTSIPAISGSSTITVTVRDGLGAPISGATVELAATGSGNTLVQPAGPTGADGVATGTLTSTAAGTKVVSAKVNGSITLTDTAQVTVTPAPATAIALVAGNNQSAPAGSTVPVDPSVKVTDAQGNGVAGYAVTFVVTGGGGSVTGGVQTTGSDGVAKVGSWTLGPAAGVNTLEARAPGLTGNPVVFTATGTPPPDHLVFQVQPPAKVKEKRVIQPPVKVAVVDKDGNVTPSAGIVIHVALMRNGVPSSQLRGTTDRTTVDGVAAFNDLKVQQTGTGYTLVASVGARPELGQAQSASFEVTK